MTPNLPYLQWCATTVLVILLAEVISSPLRQPSGHELLKQRKKPSQESNQVFFFFFALNGGLYDWTWPVSMMLTETFKMDSQRQDSEKSLGYSARDGQIP